MAFDITSVLKGAAGEVGREEIQYIDLDLIDPDENNFYSLDGIGELAGNIELIGLQQPLRVRPSAEAGRYTVVSGHRRRAALLMIRDGLDAGDPARGRWEKAACIVEYGEASDAMRELRLIYANAATRVMTSAEQGRQAERVTELLYQLKEQGVEFPGRMRDHVAEACRISKSKLARLHAIRANLDSGLLDRFDRGEIPEETAYQLQRLPKAAQAGVETCLMTGKKKELPYAHQIERVVRDLDIYTKPAACRSHAGAPDCTITNVHICRSVWEPYRGCMNLTPNTNDKGICCRDCNDRDHCSWACRECKDRRKLDAAVEKEKAAERAKAAEARQEIEQKQYRRKRQEEANRLLSLIVAAGMKDEDEMPSQYSWLPGMKVAKIREAAAGEFGDQTFYGNSWSMMPGDTFQLKKWAQTLGCSADYLLELSDDPTPAAQRSVSGSDTDLANWKPVLANLQPVAISEAKPSWSTGTPTETGKYVLRAGIPAEEKRGSYITTIKTWNGENWVDDHHVPMRLTVYRWLKLPEEE